MSSGSLFSYGLFVGFGSLLSHGNLFPDVIFVFLNGLTSYGRLASYGNLASYGRFCVPW